VQSVNTDMGRYNLTTHPEKEVAVYTNTHVGGPPSTPSTPGPAPAPQWAQNEEV